MESGGGRGQQGKPHNENTAFIAGAELTLLLAGLLWKRKKVRTDTSAFSFPTGQGPGGKHSGAVAQAQAFLHTSLLLLPQQKLMPGPF